MASLPKKYGTETIRKGLGKYGRPSGSSSDAKPTGNDDTLHEIDCWGTMDKNIWSLRNERFQRDQNLFNLTTPGEASGWARNQNDILLLNDPKVLVKKVSRIIARHPNVIEVEPVESDLGQTAQIIENFCYSWDQSINLKWMDGLRNPYRYDQAFWLTLRGWLCERTLIFPDGEPDMAYDPAAIYDNQLFDAADIYPYASSGRIVRVSHIYETTAGELKWDAILSGAAKKNLTTLNDMEDNTRVKVHACYWQTSDGGWWHAILIGGEWLKTPTEIGYNPWTLTLANGAAYRSTPWDDNNYREQIGTGILDESAQNQAYLNRAVTKLNALLSLEANPPITVFNADMRPVKITFEPGSRMFLNQKDKIEVHRIGPQLQDYQLLWNILVQRAERAGLPAAFFAEYTGESSMAHSVLMSAGRDVLYPFTEALNFADMMKYRKVLELYRDYGPSKPLKARMSPDSLGVSGMASITAEDIKKQGTWVQVSRADMTPQETLQRINTGIALAREKVLSLKTVRGRDWVGVRNPDKENLQVLAEQVYLNDDVIKSLVPVALSETGGDMLKSIWSAVQSGMPMPGSPAANQQLPPGAVPAQPGMPVPTQMMPAAAQTGNPATNINRAPPDAIMAALLGQLNGGAMGGSGAGGLPPRPGLGSPIPIPNSPAQLFRP